MYENFYIEQCYITCNNSDKKYLSICYKNNHYYYKLKNKYNQSCNFNCYSFSNYSSSNVNKLIKIENKLLKKINNSSHVFNNYLITCFKSNFNIYNCDSASYSEKELSHIYRSKIITNFKGNILCYKFLNSKNRPILKLYFSSNYNTNNILYLHIDSSTKQLFIKYNIPQIKLKIKNYCFLKTLNNEYLELIKVNNKIKYSLSSIFNNNCIFNFNNLYSSTYTNKLIIIDFLSEYLIITNDHYLLSKSFNMNIINNIKGEVLYYNNNNIFFDFRWNNNYVDTQQNKDNNLLLFEPIN